MMEPGGGDVLLILADEPEGSTSISGQKQIFKSVGEAIVGGWGGRLLAYMDTWRGAGGGGV